MLSGTAEIAAGVAATGAAPVAGAVAIARMAAALGVLGGAWLGCLLLVKALRPRTAAAAAPLALALLVPLEGAVLRALSAVEAVTALPVALANVALLAAGLAAAWHVPAARLRPLRLRRPRAATLALALVFAVAATSAVAYLPNNWDSMTYHLARVAHWIQHRSVAPYPTSIARQAAMPPGAEHLVLVLQVVSGSDRLAALVQLAAWVILVAAAVPLARRFGASRGVARAGAVVLGAAPMAVLQASSTQNDLVAAVMTLAAATAAVPLLHRRRRWRQRDLVLLLAAVAGGVLVKPTSVLVFAPLGAVAAASWARTAVAGGPRALLRLAPLAALALALAPPLLAVARQGAGVQTEFMYPVASGLADRAVNSARGLLRNLPWSERLGQALASAPALGCGRPGEMCLAVNRLPWEDSAGNPSQAVLALAALVAAAVRGRACPPRARLGAAALGAGWVLLHATLRDQIWLPRVQLAAAALVPLALGSLPRGRPRGAWRVGMAAFATVALALGLRAGVENERRPLVPAWNLALGGLPGAYYRGGPAGVAARHAGALAALGRSGCTRLGLALGGDSYDYPLTWRAMQRGVEVRHVVGPDAWPCAVFSDGAPPPPRPEGSAYHATGVAGLFVAGEP